MLRAEITAWNCTTSVKARPNLHESPAIGYEIDPPASPARRAIGLINPPAPSARRSANPAGPSGASSIGPQVCRPRQTASSLRGRFRLPERAQHRGRPGKKVRPRRRPVGQKARDARASAPFATPLPREQGRHPEDHVVGEPPARRRKKIGPRRERRLSARALQGGGNGLRAPGARLPRNREERGERAHGEIVSRGSGPRPQAQKRLQRAGCALAVRRSAQQPVAQLAPPSDQRRAYAGIGAAHGTKSRMKR